MNGQIRESEGCGDLFEANHTGMSDHTSVNVTTSSPGAVNVSIMRVASSAWMSRLYIGDPDYASL